MATFLNFPLGNCIANAGTGALFNLTTTPGVPNPADVALLVDGVGDTFFLGVFDNFVVAGIGNDTIVGGNAIDTLRGGAGNDLVAGGLGADNLSGGGGNDTIYGGTESNSSGFGFPAGKDTINGGNGNDSIICTLADDLVLGGRGNDYIDGYQGNNTINGGYGHDIVAGFEGNDRLVGSYGNDVLFGDNGNDTIFGGVGNDRINGGEGENTLNGGAGLDTFVFDSVFSVAGLVDTITGFRSVDDVIWLDRAVYAAAGPNGPLARDAFFVGEVAADAEDRIIYDREAGILYYDPDGTGAAQDIVIAILQGSPLVRYSDFLVFGGVL